MKKLFLLGTYFFLVVSAFAFTTPEKINYQGVARNADGELLANQQLGIQIQVRTTTSNGDVVYSEIHTVTTNQYGIFNLQIGGGGVESGVFAEVDWSLETYVELGIDFAGGSNFVSMGTAQLVSVPYAMHAKKADNVFSGDFNDLVNVPLNVSDFVNDAGFITNADDADADATNEIQNLALTGSTLTITNNANATAIDLSAITGANTDEQTLSVTGTDLTISGGNTVSIASLQDGFEANTDTQLTEAEVDGFVANNGYISTEVDGDVTNEIQDLSLVGSTLKITNNASATEINLAPFSGTNTDEQSLSLTGTNLSITNGNAISLASLQDGFEANTDTQTISLSGTNLTITGGNTLDVSALQDGFEADTKLTEGEVDAFVANNGYISAEVDGSITNEIQDLVLTGSTLKITNNVSATSIDLSPFAGANTDEQTLALSGTTLSISNGNNVNLSSLQDGTGTDAQVISLPGSNLAISGGNSINISSIDTDTNLTEAEVDGFVANNGYLTSEADGNPSNELQTLALSGANLSISSKNTVDLSALQDGTGTDDQKIDFFSLTGNVLSLSLESDNEISKTVNLSSLQDGYEVNTDNQTLDVSALSGTNLQLSLSGDGQATKVIDLSSLQDGTGTDTQGADVFSFDGSILSLSLDNDGEVSKTVDLSSLGGGGASKLDELSDVSVSSGLKPSFYIGSIPASDDGFNDNVGLGTGTLADNIGGQFNVAIGLEAMKFNTSGSLNTAIGKNTLRANTTGSYNTAYGSFALELGIAVTRNTALGYQALNKSAGASNTGVGYRALPAITSGAYNVGLGEQTLYSNTTGTNNVAIGYLAGGAVLGSGNVFIGHQAGKQASNSNISNKLYIDNSSTTTPLIKGDFSTDEVTINGTLNVTEVMHLTPLASAPATGQLGDMYVRTDGKLFFYSGGWKEVSLL